MYNLLLGHSTNRLIILWFYSDGGSTAPPIGVGTWCRRWGQQLASIEGSSLYQLMSTYWKENLKGKLCCVDCTRTITQCVSLHTSDQDFPNRGGGIPPQWWGIKNVVINLMVETWGEVFLTIQTFFNTKNNIP